LSDFRDKRKMHMCVTVPIGVKQGIEDSAKLFGMSQSKLLLEGYFEYLKNHYKETVKPVTLNVNQVQEAPRTVKVPKELCQIGNGLCKRPAVGVGVYDGKEYKLCSDHSTKLVGAKGWIVR